MQLIELEQLSARLLRSLWQLLIQRYPDISPEMLAQRCDIEDAWWLAQGHNKLANVLALLHELREHEAPAIALELGDIAEVSDLGLLGYAMLTSANCEQAASISCKAFSEVSFMIKVELQKTESHALVNFQLSKEAISIGELLIELCSVAAWRFIQTILPEKHAARPSFIEFAYKAPAHLQQYTELLDCQIQFGSSRSVIAFPLAWLEQPIPSGNEQLLIACSHHVQQLLGKSYPDTDIVHQVKQLLMSQPQNCAFKLENTAKLLRLKPRSLRRQLERTGSSFRQICLEVRMELAREYLCNTHLSLKEIAFQLGYNHPSNFNRAFSDYYGISPSAMRSQHYASFKPN